MSWSIRIDLMCDEDTCTAVEVFHEETVTAARAEARKDGWVTVAGGRDLCPQHAAERRAESRKRGLDRARRTRASNAAAAKMLGGLFHREKKTP